MHNLTKALLLHCNAGKSLRNIVWRNRQREAGQLRNIVEYCRKNVGKKIEKYCLEEQRESGQALQFPGAKAFGGFTIKSFLFASFATERSYDKRGKTIKVRINPEHVSKILWIKNLMFVKGKVIC